MTKFRFYGTIIATASPDRLYRQGLIESLRAHVATTLLCWAVKVDARTVADDIAYLRGELVPVDPSSGTRSRSTRPV